MAETQLNVEIRNRSGKGVARKLRAAGRAPAVVYGKGKAPVALAFDPRDLERALAKGEHGMNTLIDLVATGDGASAFAQRTVLVKEIQRDPVRGDVLHADLYEIDLTETVRVDVPIHLVGTPLGVTQHDGITDQTLREIEVECLPGSIPDSIDIDVAALDVGDSLHVSDLVLPEGVEAITDGDITVVSIAAPSAEELPEGEAAEAAAAAPEAPAAAEPEEPEKEEGGE